MSDTTIRHDSIANQPICEQLVRREVGHCVSMLMYHFAQHPEALEGSDYSWEDDVLPLCQQDDWEAAFNESDYEIAEDSAGDTYVIDRSAYPNTLGNFQDKYDLDDPGEVAEFATDQYDEYLLANGVAIDDPDDWQDACQIAGIDDPYTNEALEHWIVSDWFAGKLAEHGEMTGELFGLTIWGRCCSGQAIHLDGVIGEIAAEMGILDGQSHSWAEK